MFGAILAAGCTPSTSSVQAGTVVFKTVPVRIKITQPNQDVIVKPMAGATDVNYGTETDLNVLGTVVITAKPGRGPGKFNPHFMTGTLILKDGSVVNCDESRALFWNSDNFQKIDIPCDDFVSLHDVALLKLQP